ncbi:MAG: benzoate-CoA ligase family protein [Solidesulfovibrio sp.]
MPPNQNVAWVLLSPNLERHPDKPAYRCGDDVLTYAALARAAARTGALLASCGVRPGDRVGCVLPDGFALPIMLLGALWIGACPMPLSTALRPEDYVYILEDSGAKVLAVDKGQPAPAVPGVTILPCSSTGPDGLEAFSDTLGPCVSGAEGLALLLYTSGSTGCPKGVPHRHRDILRPVETFGPLLGLTGDDVIFSASKMSFAYGLIASLSLALGYGATAVLFSGKPGPYDLLEIIGRHRPSVFFTVPSFYNMLLRVLTPGSPFKSVRLCYSAGEALPAATFNAWKQLTGLEICEGIGSTEAFNLFISNRPGRVMPGATGEAAPGFELRLVDEAGREVQDGQPGLLRIRGEGTATSYWNLPEKSRETMLDGGWLHTGDMFVVRDGVYFHQGRADDMLKVGGRFVSPQEVENVLLAHPDVVECAVAGCRVEGLERPQAVIVVKNGVVTGPGLAGEMRRFVRERLPEEMCPARVRFVDELPKTATGKIIRRALRQV